MLLIHFCHRNKSWFTNNAISHDYSVVARGGFGVSIVCKMDLWAYKYFPHIQKVLPVKATKPTEFEVVYFFI